MRPDDLALLRTPGAAAVSPDGRIAVVAVTRLDLAADAYRSRLWAVPTDGSAPARPLTAGHRDTAPAFSPDGRWLAYLDAGEDGRPQIAVLPTAGGAARRLTRHPLGAGRPVWAPDSGRLAYTARVPGAVPRDAGAPRLITTLPDPFDDGGSPDDGRSHVFVLHLPDPHGDDDGPPPAPVQRTDGDADDADVAWSPDGAELAFVRAEDDSARTVHVVPAGGGGPRRVTTGRRACALPAYAPDGRLLVTVDDGCPVPCLVGADGALEPLLDPGPHSRGCPTPAPVVVDGAVLVGVRWRGAVQLVRVPLDGGAAEPLVEGPFTVSGTGAGGGVVVATVAHDRSAGELVAITPGRRRLLTGFGRALGETGRLHPVRERTTTAAGGATVDGWVALPDGPGPHPVLLVLHDGPSEPGWRLLDETQVAVSAGYAVVRSSPSSSDAERDADDLLALLDAALADPALDGERVGVHGAGHGGWLTARLLTRTTRFTAAVVERAAPGPEGAAGAPLDTAPIRTPTLVVHAEADWSGPPELGPRLHAELRRRGVPAELLLFPGEGRGLARCGRPRHRLARLEHLLRWWARWLPTGGRAG
ncbi:prolyl oligopeptidase family serine peptidase [Geodermatophilus sp. YIM 151500]|uniref:S9 family peptidase n=1 Tax=Geodermatophilus sp. YIM 151500 TaxID=2984531 RepID=UPI0021E4EBB8|nr:prolyl oligopeptidase family serine peptidase [Geodermatophilus sp. YIM 151500]MCV2488029.1 prolyl oligopeptidase family serine peptidase [Geodermatophilus sp. YIM 151500]